MCVSPANWPSALRTALTTPPLSLLSVTRQLISVGFRWITAYPA
jgi:hypothetical protein